MMVHKWNSTLSRGTRAGRDAHTYLSTVLEIITAPHRVPEYFNCKERSPPDFVSTVSCGEIVCHVTIQYVDTLQIIRAFDSIASL
jgi:hypothetical protein